MTSRLSDTLNKTIRTMAIDLGPELQKIAETSKDPLEWTAAIDAADYFERFLVAVEPILPE